MKFCTPNYNYATSDRVDLDSYDNIVGMQYLSMYPNLQLLILEISKVIPIEDFVIIYIYSNKQCGMVYNNRFSDRFNNMLTKESLTKLLEVYNPREFEYILQTRTEGQAILVKTILSSLC